MSGRRDDLIHMPNLAEWDGGDSSKQFAGVNRLDDSSLSPKCSL